LDNLRLLFGVGAAITCVVCFAAIIYMYFSSRRQGSIDALLRASREDGGVGAGAIRKKVEEDITGREYERLKKMQKRKLRRAAKRKATMEERYYHAGMFTRQDIARFKRIRWVILAAGVPCGVFLGGNLNFLFGLIGALFGVVAGIIGPSFVLDSKIRRRYQEIMYYLPLVIEQIAIGVSSSLDIGPCVQRVVAMADERDTHNVVTELMRQSQFLIKSGVSMEEALTEVGTRSGHTELKHAFMALAGVAKYGGEISRQLQELADAVAAARETEIEEKIKKLELEATGPVFLVFAGFIVLLLSQLGLQVAKVFQ
jgi:Flp pilus assembly protein TadB